MALSFDQAVHGAQVPLSVPTSQPCPTCKGTGAKPGTAPKVCPVCEGRGLEAQSQGIFSISQPCSNCGGSGTVIEDPCPTCAGTGAQRSVRRLRVNIPAGVHDGSRIRLAGKGEAGLRGAEPGDLYVITRVQESPVFKAAGDNLEVEVPLTIPEAVRGAIVEVPTLNGSKRLRVAPAPSTARSSACAARDRREPAARAAATFATGSSSTSPRSSRRAGRGHRPPVQGDERQPPVEPVHERCRRRAKGEEQLMAARRVRTTRVEVSSDRGVFMISVAAELADMHPQTLRMYEARGLIEPKRSPKGTGSIRTQTSSDCAASRR